MTYIEGKIITKKGHFTSNIDQDPKKQLVIDVKPVTVFKSNVSVQQSSSLFSLTYLSQKELQGPVNNIYNQKFQAQLHNNAQQRSQPTLSHLLQRYL